MAIPGAIASSARAPYRRLSNVELILDYSGLAVGTTNQFGVVDGSGNVTSWKSLAPGPVGRDFASNGTAPTLSAGNGIVFGGAGRLRHNTLSVWNFMSFNSTRANLKWTAHYVIKIGTSENPGASYGIMGNNGTSGGSKGVATFYADSSTNNNAYVGSISGGAGILLSTSQSDAMIPNRYYVLSEEVDLSQSTISKRKLFYNGTLISNINTTDTGTLVTTPSFDLEIGGCGNASIPLVGTIKEVIIQSTVETATIRASFINHLIRKHGIITSVDGIPIQVYNPFNVYSDGRYPITNTLLRSISTPATLVSVYSDWTLGHTWRTTNVISMRKSTDGGGTWGSRIVLYTDAAYGVIESGGGVASDGTFHFFFTVHTGTGTTIDTGIKLLHITSTNDGTTWSSVDDLSSLIPATDLIWAYGELIDNAGVLMKPFYSIDGPGDTDPNGRYILRKDGANPWTAVLVESTSGGTYRNECEIIALDTNGSSSRVLMLARDENSLEWRQYLSSDNGATWADQGAQDLGFTMTSASPLRLKKIQISGTDVIIAYVADRANRRVVAVYAKASDLITNGLTGWTLATKTTIRQYITSPVNQPQYGDFSHVNNTMEGIMSFALDDGTGSSTATAVIQTGSIPTWHYSSVKTALGL